MENCLSSFPWCCPMRFAFDLNLPHERGDGLDGIRHDEKPHHGLACVIQARMNTLANGPDLGLARQSGECLDLVIGHHVVKLPTSPCSDPKTTATITPVSVC